MAPLVDALCDDSVERVVLVSHSQGIGSARIEGDRYRRDGTWGHLFNVHYLAPLQRELSQAPASSELKPFRENLLRVPRLFGYYGGNTPRTPIPDTRSRSRHVGGPSCSD
jgi:hypothetical protein